MIRADIHARFVRVVARALERSEREEREVLAKLRAGGYDRGVIPKKTFCQRRREILTPVADRVQHGAG